MPFTLTQFTAATQGTGAQLDQNNKLLGSVAPMPCTVSGTNALTLTQQTSGSGAIATTIAITAYQTGMQFCGIASATNTGATTATVGAIGALSVYKPSPTGPVVLAGGEIVIGCAFTLQYDAALDGGNGGFHLISSLAVNGATIAPALVRASTGVQVGATTAPTLTGLLTRTTTVVFTALVPNSTQEQTFTIASVLSSDFLAWAFPQPVSTGLELSGYFVAGNGTIATLGVRLANVTTASTITQGTITVGVGAMRLA